MPATFSVSFQAPRLMAKPPFRPGLACRLSFALDWRRKDGQPDTLDLQANIETAVRRTKALAKAAAQG